MMMKLRADMDAHRNFRPRVRGVMLLIVATALAALVPATLPAQTAPATKPAINAPGPGPQELMQKVSQDLLRELDANRAAYTKDPTRLRALGTNTCCRTSTSTTLRAWCWASTGARRRKRRGSGSSMRSTSR